MENLRTGCPGLAGCGDDPLGRKIEPIGRHTIKINHRKDAGV